jgi:hypothetical protein
MTPEDPTIFDLEEKALRPANPLITDLSMLILIHIVPSEVTYSEC